MGGLIMPRHGMASLQTWQKKGAVFIGLDFLGHGKSDHQQDADYTVLSHALTVIYAVQVIGWDSFNLMGHSMGGAIATIVASIIPEKIQTLTLVESIGEWPSSLNPLEMIKLSLKIRSKSYYERQPKIYPDIKSAIGKLRENNSNLAELSASLIVLRSLMKVQDGFSFSHDPRLVVPNIFKFGESGMAHFIKGIKAPVMVIWTKNTIELNSQRKIGDSNLKQIFEDRVKLLNPATTTVIVFEEGSHHVHLDRPDLVLPPIEKFLQTYNIPVKPQAKL